MSTEKVKLHIFTNGTAIFELPPEISPREVADFRDTVLRSPSITAVTFGGMELEVINHPNPLELSKAQVK